MLPVVSQSAPWASGSPAGGRPAPGAPPRAAERHGSQALTAPGAVRWRPEGWGTARRATAHHRSNANEVAPGDAATGMTIFMFNCAFYKLPVSSFIPFLLIIFALGGLNARNGIMHLSIHCVTSTSLR